MIRPRCPRCDDFDVEEKLSAAEASDEVLACTHECRRCHTRFRFTPPDVPFNPPRFSAAS